MFPSVKVLAAFSHGESFEAELREGSHNYFIGKSSVKLLLYAFVAGV